MLRALVLLILLGAFNGFFFLFADSDTVNMAQWITYGFINYALFSPFIFSVVQYRRSENMATILAVSIIYMIVELIVGITILLIAPEGFKVPLFIQGLITAVELIICVSLFKLENFKR